MPAFNAATAQPVLTGATFTKDIDTRRVRRMTVAWKLLATVTAGDLTVNDAFPFVQPTDAAPLSVALPSTAVAPASDGANVVALKTYDLVGIERVRLSAKNNNAGTLNLQIDVFEEMLV